MGVSKAEVLEGPKLPSLANLLCCSRQPHDAALSRYHPQYALVAPGDAEQAGPEALPGCAADCCPQKRKHQALQEAGSPLAGITEGQAEVL